MDPDRGRLVTDAQLAWEGKLTGVVEALVALRNGAIGISSANKGWEREAFLKLFLREAFTERAGFGTGDIVDSHGNASGQVDIIVESGRLFAARGFGGTGVHIAEGVAAAIEVKSDLRAQKDEVVAKSDSIAALRRWIPDDVHSKNMNDQFDRERQVLDVLREFDRRISELEAASGRNAERETALGLMERLSHLIPWFTLNLQSGFSVASELLPFFVVDYRGWSTSEPAQQLLLNHQVDAHLQLEPLRYSWLPDGPRTRLMRNPPDEPGLDLSPRTVDGPAAVMLFLEHLASCIRASDYNFKPSWQYR